MAEELIRRHEELQINRFVKHLGRVITQLKELSVGHVVNLNIPPLSKGTPKGVRVVPQSTHGFNEKYKVRSDSDGQKKYQLTSGNHRDPHGSGWTDVTALLEGYITLTCLQQELTDNEANRLLSQKQFQLKS